jgi:hypothetical protein
MVSVLNFERRAVGEMIVNQIDWRRLHRHEPPEQRAWPMAIRTLRDFLLRLPEELDGVILSKTDDPVTDLLRVIGTQPEDRKVDGGWCDQTAGGRLPRA